MTNNNNEDKNLVYKDMAMVFSTCNEYRTIWNGFFVLFKKFFSFWKGPIFSTVADDFIEEGYCVVGNKYYGRDTSFSTRLLKTLKKIKTKYVLFFLDDFYLCDFVDKSFFESAYNTIKSNKRIKHILLKDFVKQRARCIKRYDDNFFVMKKRAQYKANTQVSIYDRKYLISLLRKGESAWDFEFYGTFRAHHKKGLALYRDDRCHNCIPYFDAGLLHKGRLQSIYKPILDQFNIQIIEPVISKKATGHSAPHTIVHIYNHTYPFLSLIFPFLRKHFSGYPSFIYKINHINKEDYLI